MPFGEIVHVVPFVPPPVGPLRDALAVDLVVLECPMEHLAIRPRVLPDAVEAVSEEVAAILVAIEIFHRSLPVSDFGQIAADLTAFDPFALIGPVRVRDDCYVRFGRCMQCRQVS